mgnify:CR=1 FL=1
MDRRQQEMWIRESSNSLRISLAEPKNKLKISIVTMSSGFEMNEEMVQFMEENPELDVQVQTV